MYFIQVLEQVGYILLSLILVRRNPLIVLRKCYKSEQLI